MNAIGLGPYKTEKKVQKDKTPPQAGG